MTRMTMMLLNFIKCARTCAPSWTRPWLLIKSILRVPCNHSLCGLSMITVMACLSHGTMRNWEFISCTFMGRSADVSILSFLDLAPTHPKTAGGKGRSAFVHAPPIDKNSRDRSNVDYSAFALTSLGTMLLAMVESGIVSYPNKHVSLQYFETIARYTDFFKVRKECILPALEAMMDARYASSLLLLHLSI